MSKSVRSQVESVLASAGIKKGKKSGGKKSGGMRKYDRERKRHASAMRYTSEKRWATNRLRRIRRHLKRNPGALDARSILAAEGTAADHAMLAKLPA
jgi:hypothetical protein